MLTLRRVVLKRLPLSFSLVTKHILMSVEKSLDEDMCDDDGSFERTRSGGLEKVVLKLLFALVLTVPYSE